MSNLHFYSIMQKMLYFVNIRPLLTG